MARPDTAECLDRDVPVCPQCGTAHGNWWEDQPPDDADTWESRCGECGCDFTVRLYTEQTFTTWLAAVAASTEGEAT